MTKEPLAKSKEQIKQEKLAEALKKNLQRRKAVKKK